MDADEGQKGSGTIIEGAKKVHLHYIREKWFSFITTKKSGDFEFFSSSM